MKPGDDTRRPQDPDTTQERHDGGAASESEAHGDDPHAGTGNEQQDKARRCRARRKPFVL